MTRRVLLSPEAREDVSRLIRFLSVERRSAAQRLRASRAGALLSLADLPERGAAAPDGSDLRELRVRFGRYGYFIQYRVGIDEVFVSRLFHAREQH